MKKQILTLLLLCILPTLSMDNMGNNINRDNNNINMQFGLRFDVMPNDDQAIHTMLTGRGKRQLDYSSEKAKKTVLLPRKSRKIRERIY